jgi:4-hydroxy-tetrahydrodipicolinate synthase
MGDAVAGSPPDGLAGVHVALSTPFGEDYQVDQAALAALVERMVDRGLHGLVTCGSTGEFATLTVAERKRVTEITLEVADGRVPVIPQTGATRTADAVELARHAAEHGAAAMLVVQPFYEAPTSEEITRYFEEVSRAAPELPVIVYNLPGATGVNLSPARLRNLAADVRQVRYVKDSAGHFAQILELLYQHDDVITTLPGWDTLLAPAFLAGARGTIWGAPNFMAATCVSIFRHCQAGDAARANDLFRRVWPVLKFLEREGYAASVKTAAELVGEPLGPPRPPFLRLAPQKRDQLTSLLADAGLL